jgi:hypothetical protein
VGALIEKALEFPIQRASTATKDPRKRYRSGERRNDRKQIVIVTVRPSNGYGTAHRLGCSFERQEKSDGFILGGNGDMKAPPLKNGGSPSGFATCAKHDSMIGLEQNLPRKAGTSFFFIGGSMSKATAAKPSRSPEADHRPVHEIRHRNIRATIWKNQTAKGVMYNVTVSRSYRDDAGAWHDTGSFAFGDLMNLAKALYDAHSAIANAIAHDRASRTANKSTAES